MSDPALAELLAKQAITERLHDYCRAMDRIDDELGCSVFHPDAVADYGTIFSGTGHGFVEWVHHSHTAMLATNHKLSNISIRIDGERAGSEAYVTMHGRMPGEGGAMMQIQSLGRYIDRWERRGGEWRISHRRYLQILDELRPVGMAMYETEGARDRSDPSYAALGGT
jgi:SnoaL-like domain